MTTWQVRCADGVVRVEEAFPSRRAAIRFMTWDHFCYFDPHRVVPVRPASDPNRDLAQREAELRRLRESSIVPANVRGWDVADTTTTILVGSEEVHHPEQCPAWYTGVPGLLITPYLDLDGWYTITHVGSGRNMGSYVWSSIAAARRAARRLGELTDWSQHDGYLGSVAGELLHLALPICQEEGQQSVMVQDFWKEDADAV